MANKSDGQSENAAKAFHSSVSGRTRSKRDAIIHESHRTCFSSQNASHASAPTRHNSSSFNKIGKTVLGRVSTSQGCTSKHKSRPMKPAPSVGRPRKSFGNGSEDLDLEGNEPIDKDSFRIQVECQNSCSSSKENFNASFSAATPRKDANVCRNESSAGYCGSFCPEDAFHGSDPAWQHESRSFIQLDSDSDDMKPEDIEVKGIDESGFRNQKSSFESKSRQSAEQVYCFSCSSKKVDSAKKSSRTSAMEVNNDEDTDPEEYGIEEIDEAEFKNRKKQFTERVDESDSRQFITKVGPSTWQDSNEEHFAATTARNVKRVSRKNVHEMDSSSSESIDSSSSEFDSDDVNMSLLDEEVSTCGAKHETGPGIATRTRSKLGNIKKPVEVGNVSSSLSLDSDSSPTDSGDRCYHDERESSDGGIEFLGLNLKACEIQNYKSMKVSEETKDCSKNEGSAVEYKSNCDERKSEAISSDLHVHNESETLYMADETNVPVGRKEVSLEHNETKCCAVEQSEAKQASASQSQKEDCRKEASQFQKDDCSKGNEEGGVLETMKFSSRKRRLSHDASSKPAKERKAENTSKVVDRQGNNEAISKVVDMHVHEKTETPFMADETNVPVGRKQVSLEHNDICSRLADDVLARILVPENKENQEAATQVPASQIQNTLPLKFRFEDEVPELVEKTEYEKELEEQFSLLDSYWALEEMRSFDYPKVDLENGNSPREETQYARCCRGKHELVLDDEEGLICKFCRHEELGPKDVLPEWAERTCRGSERRGVAEMEELLEFDELHLQSSFDNVADFRSATGTVWRIKPGVQESMYEHQQQGFEFLWKNLAGSINLDELKSTDPGEVGGCIISHAPGTGKTRLTIVFLETYLKLFPNCYPVIIAPASMLLTWEDEFRKWEVKFPFLNLSNVELSAKEKDSVGLLPQPKSRDMEYIRRIKMSFWSKGERILGISYSLFEKLTGKKKDEKMRKILLEMPGLVVLDEGHTPRNQRSSIWKAFQELKTRKRIILSGTPFQNNFGELFNTLRIVRPEVADVLAQEKMFDGMVATRKSSSRRKHNVQSTCLSEQVVDRAVEKLKSWMSPFVHVHKGTILQQSLPGLRDCVVLLKPPPLQKSLIERIEGNNTFKFEHDVALISVHPYLFRHCDVTKDQLTGIDMGAVEASKLNHQEGVKTRFVVELIRLSMAVEEKVLVFSQFIQPLQLIKEQLKELFQWVEGRQVLQMQGNVDLKQRQVLINQFNDPHSESKVMLASIKCCSEGISLVGASRVVLIDVVWNPSVERQAICRAYRIGQKKFVYTYHLMTSGTTEADKYCRQAEKERLSELVFSSSNESDRQKHPSSGIEDRILELMVGHKSLNEMFEKIINQPKGTDLIQTFGHTS